MEKVGWTFNSIYCHAVGINLNRSIEDTAAHHKLLWAGIKVGRNWFSSCNKKVRQRFKSDEKQESKEATCQNSVREQPIKPLSDSQDEKLTDSRKCSLKDDDFLPFYPPTIIKEVPSQHLCEPASFCFYGAIGCESR